MECWIKIGMDNDAFVGCRQGETGGILRNLAENIENDPFFSPGRDVPLYDTNGNEVGFCGVYDEPKILHTA